MKKLLVILLFLVSTNASAGILLEPYMGYMSGSSSNTPKLKLTGPNYGARLGYAMPGLFFALDYTLGILEGKQNTTTLDYDHKASALVVGTDVDVLRLWAGYTFANELDQDGNNGVYEGSGFKFGLGYKIIEMPLSLNFEYLIDTYDELDGANLPVELKINTMFFSVSVPLEF